MRHWHEQEDEFVYILEGECVLIEDDGETVLKAGRLRRLEGQRANGHCIVNRSNARRAAAGNRHARAERARRTIRTST